MISTSLKERVYSSVIHGIISGEYTVDTVLSENQLCKKLQVSKSPVREALVELCSQGILRSVPRCGYIIVRYTDRNIRDILQFRTMLECGCLESSFDRITPTQLRHLEEIVTREFSYLSERDRLDYWDDTLNFHLTLASFADNEYIYNQLRQALNTSIRAYLQFYWDKWDDSFLAEPSVLHRQLVQCIRDGDRQKSIALLEKDINTFLILDRKPDTPV